MLERLIEIDKSVLLFFNGGHSAYLDKVMWIYSGKLIWLPLVLVILWAIFYKKKFAEAFLVLVMVVLVATLCDQISSSLIKPFFARFRPAQDPDFSSLVQIVNGYRGGRYGFVSIHAANSFGVVPFVILLYRNKWLSFTCLLWAVFNCYSRMFLGVHFPGDILFGSLLGIIIGVGVWFLYKYMRGYMFKKEGEAAVTIPYIKDKNAKYISIAVWTTFVFILIFAPLIGFW